MAVLFADVTITLFPGGSKCIRAGFNIVVSCSDDFAVYSCPDHYIVCRGMLQNL